MDEKTLKKGITFAAMLSYIRSSVVEQMLPVSPYLLRFNIDDYTYFTDYVRDKCLSGVYKEGLYAEFLSSCEDLKDYLLKTQGKLQEKEDFWTIQKLEQPDSTPLSKVAGTFDERLAHPDGADNTMSLFQQFHSLKNEAGLPDKASREAFLREWKKIEKDKAKLNFPSGDNPPLSPDDAEVDKGKGGSKTPYMLSNYYGNVYPIGKRQLEAQVDEDSIWSNMGSFLMGIKMFSVNGVPMTPAQTLKRALILLCFNPDAFGAMVHKGDASPSRVQDYGVIGFKAFSKPPMIVPADLLDALIVLETTAYINKVKSLKSDPMDDWDWPIDFEQTFFSKLLPKPNYHQAQQHAGVGESNAEDAAVRSYMFPQRIMYVPVLDVEPQTTYDLADGHGKQYLESTPENLLSKDAFLSNFPWAYHHLDTLDGAFDREEAKKAVAQPLYDSATGAPLITNTVGSYQVLQTRTQRTPVWNPPPGFPSNIGNPFKTMEGEGFFEDHFMSLGGSLPSILQDRAQGELLYGSDEYEVSTWDDGFVEDKYNGGTQFHMKTGGFVLQMYAYIDSYLWERVDQETLETIESPGLRRLLYLFGNRSFNLKGAVNPHYWNSCMTSFFQNLEEKTDGRKLEFTEQDLQMFKNRMGAEYANIKMGLRLCWMVPSGMPPVFDQRHPESGKVWWGKEEYGDKDLIAAYKKIKTDPDMNKKYLEDKCHVYVVNHDQHTVDWTHKKFLGLPASWEEMNETVTDILKAETQITEYAFCFPICEVLSDQPAILDPENWNIVPESLSLKRNSDHMIGKLIKKMAKDEDFRVMFEYIFPIKSIIPEIATIYGMEFFKPVSDFMTVRKDYFGPVRTASSTIVKSFKQNHSYDNSDDE